MAPADLPPRPADSKRKIWVFNPPPGWPTPASDWRPQPGWRPDPGWPPAPAGWKFWKRVPRPGRRRVSIYIKAIAGVLTFAATITGTYLAYLAIKGHPATTSEWVRQADAACDQDIGTLTQSIFEGLAPSTTSPGDSSAPSSQVTKTGAMVAAAGSFSKLIGDLSAIAPPEDSRAPKVQAVLSSGTALVNDLDTFSTAAQEAVEHTPGTTTSQELAIEASAHERFSTLVVSWEKAIGALSLTQCPFWTSHPAPAQTLPQQTLPPSPVQNPAGSLTVGEQQLVNALNPEDLTNCTSRPDLENDEVVAAVNCQAVEQGPTDRPLVVQFSDIDSAQAWFSNNTAGYFDRGDCAAGYKLGTWSYKYVVAGPLGCTYTEGGSFRMVWVIDNALIGVIVDGSYGSTMYAWWANSAYVVSGDG